MSVIQLVRPHQPQVARWQRRAVLGLTHHLAQPVHALGHAAAQHLAVALAGHAVGQHTRHTQTGTIFRQAVGHGAKGLGHGRCVDHQQNRQIPQRSHIGRTARAVEQAHPAFDQHHIVAFARARQALLNVGLAAHGQIQVVHGLAARQPQPGGVEKIRPAFEDLHPCTARMQHVGQRRRDRGLALPRRGGGHQKNRAVHGISARRGRESVPGPTARRRTGRDGAAHGP
ncbi:hypothetical protein SDC9_145022 [bioreactor metagenome]|uniref:Uncharacterized protein n=1 Tax=bioreactor metagenome TaxID=1076179 RepID=A0A645EB18_9ZZZZ